MTNMADTSKADAKAAEKAAKAKEAALEAAKTQIEREFGAGSLMKLGDGAIEVEARPGELPQALVHTFDSVRIALYRSKLRPTGAEYVSLANLDLPPTAPGPGGEG